MEKLGIYVHIPFCIKKCSYCDFISYEQKYDMVKSYVQALLEEIRQEAKKFKENIIDTIYIGGGTPSSIDSKYIIEILEELYKNFKIQEDAEITIEVNPGTVEKEKLQDYKKVKINRISIGLQSTNNEILGQIGRIHNYEKFIETYKLIREVGFNNVNIDLMLALPKQTVEILEESVKKVIDLQPEHISLYSLILEEGTGLYKKYNQGKITLPEDDTERKMYWNTKKILEGAGYIHYEISNFAKKGYFSKHNMNCWKQKQYIGFGVAAHSFINNVRTSNTIKLEDYIKSKNKEEIKKIEEKLNEEDLMKEYMILGLRKIEGVSIQEFKTKFIKNPLYEFRNELNKLVEQGMIEIDTDSIKLTNKGLDFANIVWEEFI